jgi:hypothetical protein
MRYRILFAAALFAVSAPTVARAQVFTANFNSPSDAANWTVNVAPTANGSLQSAEFGFDYSAFGIPAAPANPLAPGPTDTLGLRLRANIPGGAAAPVTTRPAGVTSGLSVSPTGQNFGTSYRVSFQAWSNFNGAPNASGLADNANSEGGTNNVMFALGTSGTVPLVVGNTGLVTNGQMDGVGFATTGDGGITNDYRVYPKSGTIVPGSNAAVYPANSNANTATLYANLFPSVTAPAIQQTLSTAEYGSDASNTQAGSTQVGAFGFAWHYVVITTDGTTATWDVDGTRLANLDLTTLGALGGNNFALGESDVNSTTTRHPSLLFSVFDNLAVTPVPEPSTFALAGLAIPALLRLRRRGKA